MGIIVVAVSSSEDGARTAESPRGCMPAYASVHSLECLATRMRFCDAASRGIFGLLLCGALSGSLPACAADESSPARRAAHQLMGAQLLSGQFAFEHDFLLGGRRAGTERGLGRLEYITRQAAAAYGLSDYFLYDPQADIGRALVAVLRNLGELSLPVAKAPTQAALEATGILALPVGRYKLHAALQWLRLLYRPAGAGRLVSYDRSYETAWGGATALALLTELQFYRASGDAQFAPLRQAWLQGLLVLYDSGRGFRELPGSIEENALSNGEIWLALAYYTRLFPDDRATSAVLSRMDDYMTKTYGTRPDAGFYSWGMKAAAQRLNSTRDAKFSRFIAQQSRAYLDRVGPPAGLDANSCAVVEGLATALRVLMSAKNPDRDLIVSLRQRVHSEMAKNRLLQIQPGQTRIELGNNAYLSSPSIADYAGAFLAGTHEPYVRIDYTEHCISALLELGEGNR
jgi:hypothetical protein